MNELVIDHQSIQESIYTIRGMQVMVDKDLSELYGVETKRINEAVKNNQDKFPEEFFFELSDEEFVDLRSKTSTTKFAKTRTNPKVFTEQGVYTEVYHFGASLKDLGKKWFAVSKMDISSFDMIKKLGN